MKHIRNWIVFVPTRPGLCLRGSTGKVWTSQTPRLGKPDSAALSTRATTLMNLWTEASWTFRTLIKSTGSSLREQREVTCVCALTYTKHYFRFRIVTTNFLIILIQVRRRFNSHRLWLSLARLPPKPIFIMKCADVGK